MVDDLYPPEYPELDDRKEDDGLDDDRKELEPDTLPPLCTASAGWLKGDKPNNNTVHITAGNRFSLLRIIGVSCSLFIGDFIICIWFLRLIRWVVIDGLVENASQLPIISANRMMAYVFMAPIRLDIRPLQQSRC